MHVCFSKTLSTFLNLPGIYADRVSVETDDHDIPRGVWLRCDFGMVQKLEGRLLQAQSDDDEPRESNIRNLIKQVQEFC